MCAPSVAPYRDAGEMSSVLATMGVAHQPGYPLYTVLGSVFARIPLGNMAYRANIFSALAGSVALVFLFLFLYEWTSALTAFFTTLCFGFSHPFWELCVVSEMYSLGVLIFCALLFTTFVRKDSALTFFIFGLALGVRMDLLLFFPLFCLWFFISKPKSNWIANGVSFALGASVFFFLYFRSRSNPALDWAHPDSLMALFNSMTRKSYSGTLDLLSLSYQTGENFWVNLELYIQHIYKVMGLFVIFILFLGGQFLKNHSKELWFILGGFLLSGPIFLFLANMPPNPHAVAIVEASYLVPDLLLVILIGMGLESLLRLKPIELKGGRLTVVSVLVILTGLNLAHGFVRASKRDNYFNRDYTENVLRSIPPHGVAVFHKDVQLFSLWYSQLIEKKRLDCNLISTGLSASPWYWNMLKKWGVPELDHVAVKSTEGFVELFKRSFPRALVVGYETEGYDPTAFRMVPQGLTAQLLPPTDNRAMPLSFDFSSMWIMRNDARYGETPDFFSTDLIGDQSRAFLAQGHDYALMNQPDKAEWNFKNAIRLNPTEGRPYVEWGYMLTQTGQIQKAYVVHKMAVERYRQNLIETSEYKSLPDVVSSFKTELANALVSLGANAEKLGSKVEAREHYQESLDIFPSAQAHYNMAVAYWNEDWVQVVSHLEQALRFNPNNPEWQKYLMVARTRVASIGKTLK